MESGRIVQTGTADDIVFRPNCDYVRRFVANINPLSVLKADTVMQPLTLDDRGNLEHVPSGVRVHLKKGRPVACLIGNQAVSVSNLSSNDNILAYADSVLCVPRNTSIRQLLSRAASSSLCTLVVDDDGLACGVVNHQAICASLSR
jgi:glycine betaine/proline transport system ATP-binding protein